jgi:hypothetical protein
MERARAVEFLSAALMLSCTAKAYNNLKKLVEMIIQ